MAISEKDIKKLWGLAAGRCSKPGCEVECIKFLDLQDPTILGDMAHVIDKRSDGSQDITAGGDDSYENLILLCPAHHAEIDKAPDGVFPSALLREWKKAHEDRVRNAFASPKYQDRSELVSEIKRFLSENKSTWKLYAPESEESFRHSLYNLQGLWELRKLDTIVPNNRRIVKLIQHNRALFDIKIWNACTQFIEHAENFERDCYIRTEAIPRFPKNFEEAIDHYADIH